MKFDYRLVPLAPLVPVPAAVAAEAGGTLPEQRQHQEEAEGGRPVPTLF